MGVGWIYFEYLDRRGVFGDGGGRVLDLGAQHIYDIPIEAGRDFLLRHGSTLGPDEAERQVSALAKRGKWPPTRNPVYLGEFLSLCALEYTALDIFEAPGATIFDLNFESVGEAQRGRYDAVLNFGTTEHVFNQFNCFKVVHESARPGAYMFHQVPCSGYLDHGYWVYSPRLFVELAEANDYELCDLWCSGPQGRYRLLDRADYHPALTDPSRPENAVSVWRQTDLVDGLVNALFRKRTDAPFRLGLDATTSAGGLDSAVYEAYRPLGNAEGGTPRGGSALRGFGTRVLLAELLRRFRHRLVGPRG